jgi:hypothetical protein
VTDFLVQKRGSFGVGLDDIAFGVEETKMLIIFKKWGNLKKRGGNLSKKVILQKRWSFEKKRGHRVTDHLNQGHWVTDWVKIDGRIHDAFQYVECPPPLNLKFQVWQQYLAGHSQKFDTFFFPGEC